MTQGESYTQTGLGLDDLPPPLLCREGFAMADAAGQLDAAAGDELVAAAFAALAARRDRACMMRLRSSRQGRHAGSVHVTCDSLGGSCPLYRPCRYCLCLTHHFLWQQFCVRLRSTLCPAVGAVKFNKEVLGYNKEVLGDNKDLARSPQLSAAGLCSAVLTRSSGLARRCVWLSPSSEPVLFEP